MGRDLLSFGLPMEKMVHDAWSRGRLPVWSENVSGGRPLFANPSSGSLYPLRPLLSRVSFPEAMRLFPLAQWFLGGLGMLLALRALSASSAGAWVGAATFVFSGVLVAAVDFLPQLPAATMLPWVVWASARPARNLGGRAVPLGVVFGLLVLLGDAFGVASGLLVALLWVICRERGERITELGRLAAGLTLAGLLAAPQIVATALLVPETHRAVTGISLREALAFTLSPWRLLELIAPFPFGEFWTLEDREAWSASVLHPFYATLYCGAFAVIALVALRRDRTPGARFGKVLVLCGAALAIVFRFVPESLLDRSSGIPLRFPEKFTAAIVLGLALLAGIAADRFRAGARPAGLLGVAGALTAVAVAAAWFPAAIGSVATGLLGVSGSLAAEAGRSLAAAFAEAGLLWVLTMVAIELLGGGRAAVVAALALLTVVPIAANRRIARTVHESAVFPPTAFARTIARKDPTGSYRTVDSTIFHPASPLALAAIGDPYRLDRDRQDWSWATPVLWHRGTVLNLDPDFGDFSRLTSLRRVSGYAAKSASSEPFFGAISLRFGTRYRDQPPLPGFQRFGGDGVRDWDENPAALPDIRLLERWREEDGALAALEELPRLSDGEVVIETGARSTGEARAGQLTLVEKTPERLVLEANCPDPTWLFVLRGFWVYRTIRVNGREAAAAPAQLAFSALRLEAGTSRVEWTEEAPGWKAARWGPGLFGVLAVVLLRRTPVPPGEPSR